jgi:hypothetical protein
MTNSTPLYMTASGGSLHTFAWQVKTKGGSRNQLPPKRGEDYEIPFLTGRRYVPKVHDGRPYALPMWVLGLNTDGSEDSTMDKRAKLENNWRFLMGLFKAGTRGQFNLTKRFYVGNTIMAATAKAEMVEPPEPTASGQDRYDFVADLWLANPWFYTSVAAQSVGTINVLGDASTDRLLITMGNGRITSPDGNWIQYNGTGTVVINTSAGTAKKGTQYVNGLVTRNPNFREMMKLDPGVNELTGPSGATIAYKAAWA